MNFDLIAKEGRAFLAQGDARSAIEAADRFDVIVFCAQEFQPPPSVVFQRNSLVRIIQAPNNDAELTNIQAQVAIQAAEQIAQSFAEGNRILVTCWEGRNRSGFVLAIALHLLYGIGGARASSIVRARRKGARALTNPNFNNYLNRIKPSRPSGEGPRPRPM